VEWPEPFGMVMIEAMACGTPVIAFGRGAVPEVLAHGVNGVIVDDVEQAVNAVARIGEIDRAQCRRSFEQRFTAARMADDYLRVYERLLGGTRATVAARDADAQLCGLRPAGTA
jgi:glycosyltransferase involved in cell wall biosynthesis